MTEVDEQKPIEREGPNVEIRAWCYGCKHHDVERYRVQGDSGYDHSCTHGGKKRDIPSAPNTPDWCPFLKSAVKTFALSIWPE